MSCQFQFCHATVKQLTEALNTIDSHCNTTVYCYSPLALCCLFSVVLMYQYYLDVSMPLAVTGTSIKPQLLKPIESACYETLGKRSCYTFIMIPLQRLVAID